MNRFRRLGLQRRIMLYVIAGLTLLFGLLGLVGLQSIDEATRLVFQERLTTAYTTAGILERDLGRVGVEIRETAAAQRGIQSTPADLAPVFLRHLADAETFSFFRVSGIWILDRQGALLAASGAPAPPPAAEPVGRSVVSSLAGDLTVLRSFGQIPGEVPLAAVALPLALAGGDDVVVVVHTISINSTDAYVPATYGRPGLPDVQGTAAASDSYHLEVVAPDGFAVLGVGPDETPGQPSVHYLAIRALMAERGAAALLHEPRSGQTFAPHVMAVVPLGTSPFYVVLEQPVDVALALPMELRQRLLGLIALGYLATLAVAWITTRHVVKPTEQLTAAAQRMAQGDLASPIAVTAEDEVAVLAESLEAMRGRLQAAYALAERTNRELEARVAERTARLGQLVRTTINAQEEERHRLARELHDETAQTLAALSIALDRARDSLEGDGVTQERIQEARAIATRLLAETRRLILGLRPALLDDMGLIPALRWHCDHTFEASEVTFTIGGRPGRLPRPVEVALFRIVQEAVANAYRHGAARNVWIGLERHNGKVRVAVRDDGHGFDAARALDTNGASASVGLLGMQERVAILSGTLAIHSVPGSGTEVVVDIPIAGEDH